MEPHMGILGELQARLQYFDGHSDTLGLFADADFLALAARAMAAPFAGSAISHVAGIESRGFVLASVVALELDAGFVAIRKGGPNAGILPGPKVELEAEPDWRGRSSILRLQRHVVGSGDRVLVVDDWGETGSKALAARSLIERCGGEYAGLSLLVDQLPPDVRHALRPVAAAARADQVMPR
jgi:adenine phosphoribosyltransferase